MNMSFFLTQDQIIAQDKDVTRRLNWKAAKVGRKLVPVQKCQGLKEGERPVQIGSSALTIVGVRRERLNRMITEPEYGQAEAIREGFPLMTGREFVEMFCKHMKVTPSQWVTRIQFTYDTPRGRQ